jgi:N-acetylglucosaminyl-diphospho-decaprenol L-rhamnosyltransferase
VSLSIITLSFGHEERFRPLLKSLLVAGISSSDILLVHNPYGPHDSWLPSPPHGVEVLRMPANLGYGAAMNAGINAVARKSSAVLLLTHDTRLGPDALRHLMAAFESAPEYGVLGPAVELGGQLAIVSYGGRILSEGDVDHLTVRPAVDDRGVADAAWVDGSAILIRMSALRTVGGLSSRYFMYFEEPELCDRMRAAGWHVGVVPAATAFSEPGFGSRPAAFGYLFARNGLHWARSHGGSRFAMRFAVRQLRTSWREVPKPGTCRFRDLELRRRSVLLAIGRCTGLCAGLFGASGPPPGFLAGTANAVGERD